MIIAKRESSAKQSGAEPNVGGSPLAADSSDTCRAGGDPGSARGSRAAGTTEVAAWGARGPQLPGARAPPVRDHVTRAARVGIAAAAGRSSLRETRASRRGPGPPARSVWRNHRIEESGSLYRPIQSSPIPTSYPFPRWGNRWEALEKVPQPVSGGIGTLLSLGSL
ncbi:probable low affinity copper uptake protein 2 isoform X2 [Marmota marmota marmota]|uniref:probable low affinity copper uptake protein 2 isoform X2 n=1 Tax=Marmota marmota marmota TaxID=9994 RepID=UPI002092D959|nr:probable low affinity copper uptake protein 2 isoform X2 [Marmota marmota marmota]